MSRHSKRAFTLVEMLVVIAIIGVLSALLLPAVMQAINTARNAVIAMEVNQLSSAIETYRLEKGDYPPNFRGTAATPRDATAFLRHVRKCYPRIDSSEISTMIDMTVSPPLFNPAYQLDEGEALVFWLSGTRTDPIFPFGFSAGAAKTGFTLKKYYDFDETRLVDGVDVAGFQSFTAKYCKDTCYVYIDSRSYDYFTSNFPSASNSGSPGTTAVYAFAEDSTIQEWQVRPYWTASSSTAISSPKYDKDKYKPVNQTTFQIICAGQDGDFGTLPADTTNTGPKVFPSGVYYNQADKDNIANFTGGKTLGNSIP